MRRVIRDIGAILFTDTTPKTLFFQKSLSHKTISYSILSSHRQHYLQSLIGALNPTIGWRIPILSKNLSSHRPLNRLSVLPLLPQDRKRLTHAVTMFLTSFLHSALACSIMVEPMGIEPTTSCLQGRRSPS